MTRDLGRLCLAPVVLLLLTHATPLSGRVLLSQQEALALAFPPGVELLRQAHFLTAAQIEAASALAGESVKAEIWTRYIGRKDGVLLGTAYFDSHRVRTLPETLMVVVDSEGRVLRVEVLTFSEPSEYLPRDQWFAQFEDQPLGADLAPGRAIRTVTGATLSSRAATAAVRRVLAVHEVLADAEARPPRPAKPRSAKPTSDGSAPADREKGAP